MPREFVRSMFYVRRTPGDFFRVYVSCVPLLPSREVLSWYIVVPSWPLHKIIWSSLTCTSTLSLQNTNRIVGTWDHTIIRYVCTLGYGWNTTLLQIWFRVFFYFFSFTSTYNFCHWKMIVIYSYIKNYTLLMAYRYIVFRYN